MSYDAIQRVWDFSNATGSARLVLLAIATHEGKTGVSWPSLDRLAERTKISRRQVIRVISDLEDSGELAILHGRGRASPNIYSIMVGLSADDQNAKIERLAKFADNRAFSPVQLNNGVTVTPLRDSNRDNMSPIAELFGDIQIENGDTKTVNSDAAVALESFNLNDESRKEMTNQTWLLVMDNIRPEVDRAFFETWVKPLTPIGWRGDDFAVRTSGKYHRDLVSARIGAMINGRFPAIVNRPEARVEFFAQ